ncbi:ANTAR domain-containing protein [Krasilnikovia sp. M28-CT-15]|uniref:ANTAR domain-containing protein n=1 Tax=Krasilnikovia sp. M28-CT-15 TaxID=3373540 RepID=UPI00399C8A19
MHQLSEEVAGLRRAQRTRGVIEQAKGVLMGRLRCTADQAFAQLLQISQQTNTRVTEVAAGLLGMTSPAGCEFTPPPAAAGGDQRPSRHSRLPDQDVARYYLTCAAMSAARNGNELAGALQAEGLAQLGTTGVVLAVREADGAIRLAGFHGLPGTLASAWERVPGSLNVAFLRAVAEGNPLWLSRAEAAASGLELLDDSDFRACLPLRRGRHVFGVAMFLWHRRPELDPTTRAYLTALAAAAGRRLDQLTSHHSDAVSSPAAHWLEAIIDALPGSFALLCPVTDDWGRVVDWCYDKTSPEAHDAAGRSGDQLVGRRLLELYPSLAGTELLRGYDHVLATGIPFSHEWVPEHRPPGAAAVSVRAARLGDGVLVSWQHDDPELRVLGRAERLQRATGAGWAEWDLQTRQTVWAAETHELLNAPDRCLDLADLPDCMTADDVPVLQEAVREVLDHRGSTDVTVTPQGSVPGRRVRMVIDPVLDGGGRVIAACAAVCASGASPDVDVGSSAHGRGRAPASPRRKQPSETIGGPAAVEHRELLATVRRLRVKLAGLRRRQQAQAILDQSRGILAVQLGCSIDAAAEELIRTSHRRRRPIVATAADVVGVPVPVLPEVEVTDDVEFSAERYLRQPAPVLVRSDGAGSSLPALLDDRLADLRPALDAADNGDALATTLWAAGLRDLGVTAVVLGVLEPDGAVRLVGTYGLPESLSSAWRRTPSWANVVYLRAVATDRPLWITRLEAEKRAYQMLGEGELRACFPLHESDRIFGVASVIWEENPELDGDTRSFVAALAEAGGRRLSQLVNTGDGTIASPAAHWAERITAALPAGYAILRPIRDALGQVIDWRFETCSPDTRDVAGRRPDQIAGCRLRNLYPHASDNGIVDTYAAALRSGAATIWGPGELDITTPNGTVTVNVTVRACRFGDGVLVHWQQHDRLHRLTKRLELIERVADCGWAEWDIAGGGAVWSPAVYDILKRDRQKGPIKLGALHRYVAAEDEDTMTEVMQSLTRRGESVDRQLTLRRHGQVSKIRFAAEPVTDRAGRLTAVHAVFQVLSPG